MVDDIEDDKDYNGSNFRIPVENLDYLRGNEPDLFKKITEVRYRIQLKGWWGITADVRLKESDKEERSK